MAEPVATVNPSYNVNVTTRQRTPDLAVENFEGEYDAVYGREVRPRRCTRRLVNFALQATVVLLVLIASFIILVVKNFEGDGSTWLMGLVGLCLGVLIDGPRLAAN